ncbi:MAG: NADPH-dependent glutamate synthase [Candidatus Eisenbacteria bacterium]|uniref:NADPH-dependent glutamate synthase n=1 Tax=Eiseniibacteriota bacterium TaxID=2212470 RepID=A0A948RXU3_UNCEI|nr:NADPH-dependent glutamate synthase [Candidatus Eisenbacteria bacterium]MBU1948892.1 NADPH-dependent glutamate synthase [Candidatus Eisenbacteria bacterium]MBU2691543.1 NADPH-dependent glutamate synthase [Candidatus Eisenbacteria bacterium]
MAEKKKMIPHRFPMPKQTPEERIFNFEEVALGFTPKLAMQEAERCLDCKKPQCIDGCPVEINIPGFIMKIREGDFGGAARILKEKNALPAVCGRVCPQEEQCEKHCIMGKKMEPVAIGRLERFASDWESSQGKIEMPDIAPPTGKKVAVVGAGPAGITVASDLAVLGHKVEIFEALHAPGGVLIYGIPEFRLPKAIVQREVEYVQSLGVDLHLDFVVGKTRSIESFLKQFDAIFVASGAGLPWFLEIPGENLNGVYSANEYLTRLNLMKGYRFPEYDTPIKRPHKVTVTGGGNIAMDSARTAIRLGADEVHIVYRRSRSELPARLEEVENAEEEGVIFDFLTLPVRMIGNDQGWLTGMECLKMELGEPDSSGRRRPVPIENSNFILETDASVCSIGNSPNPLIPQTTEGLEIGRKGNIVADEETGKTSLDRVWAGGDVVTGAATVIMAMGAGRKAARSMQEYLSG